LAAREFWLEADHWFTERISVAVYPGISHRKVTLCAFVSFRPLCQRPENSLVAARLLTGSFCGGFCDRADSLSDLADREPPGRSADSATQLLYRAA
jgi:hypothetical protein